MHKIVKYGGVAFWETVQPVQARNTDVKTLMMMMMMMMTGLLQYYDFKPTTSRMPQQYFETPLNAEAALS